MWVWEVKKAFVDPREVVKGVEINSCGNWFLGLCRFRLWVRKGLKVALRFNGNEYWEEYDMAETMYPTQEALQKQVEEYIL